MSDYEIDTFLWSELQAGLLRRRAAGELVNEGDLDWLNLAEEIDALGSQQRRDLASRIATILLHLMKLAASPSMAPRAGWRETVRAQRDELGLLLAESPSLRGHVPAVIAAAMGRARLRAGEALADYGEAPAVDLEALEFGVEQVVGDWWP